MKRAAPFAIAALVLSFSSAGGSAEMQSGDPGDIERAGCLVRTERVDTRGVATVSAACHWAIPPESVLATLRSPKTLRAALSSLEDFRRLSDGRVVQVHRVGWPLADRQVTLDWRESALPEGGVRFAYRRAAKQEPLRAGRVAIVEDEGLWLIRPDGAGGTKLSYTSRYDAGGSLKPWLVRRFQKGGVAASLAELRAALSAR